MSNQSILEAIVVSKPTREHSKTPVQLALFNANGTPKVLPNVPTAAQADSVAATVGALVTDFNALLAKLRTAGILGS